MAEFEYRVDSIIAQVAEGDVKKGTAGSKVASQVEIKLNELSKQRYEFYREFPVNVDVATGCGGKKGKNDVSIQIIVMVFRRAVA